MALATVVAAIQDVAGALAGIKAAPDHPPEAANQFPFSLAYPLRETVTGGPAGMMKRIVTIGCQIHCARQLLPRAVEQATPYGDTFPAAIWADLKLAGTVNHVNEIRAEFGYMEYAGVKTIGWSFEIDAKIEEAV